MTGLYSKHLDNKKKAVFRNLILAFVLIFMALVTLFPMVTLVRTWH